MLFLEDSNNSNFRNYFFGNTKHQNENENKNESSQTGNIISFFLMAFRCACVFPYYLYTI